MTEGEHEKEKKNAYVGIGDTCGDEGAGSLKIDLLVKMRHKNEKEMSPTDDVKRKTSSCSRTEIRVRVWRAQPGTTVVKEHLHGHRISEWIGEVQMVGCA